jgi:phospholipase C
MENKDSGNIVHNPQAPFINGLIHTYGYAARYYGVTHPSLPNYLSLVAGDFLNTWDDWDGNRYTARTIADQLEARHLTWKAYMGGIPYPGFTGDMYPAGKAALYESKHDPFVLMRSIRNSPSRRRNIVSDQQIFRDLRSRSLPTLSFVSPDMCHDMHGIIAKHSPCPANQQHLIAAGDRYLARLIPAIVQSREWTDNSVIFLIWDEADKAISGCCLSPKGDGGGRVVAIVMSRTGPHHVRSTTPYNHYSVLKTLETLWGLPCLANTCKSQIKPMTEFLRPHQR